jgi:hypothetical protein
LIADFEKDDEVLAKAKESERVFKQDMIAKGQELAPRHGIRDAKTDLRAHLDANMGT